MKNNWQKELAAFDKEVSQEESRNKKVIEILSKNIDNNIELNTGLSDGAENHRKSINSLSSDPNIKGEIRFWRKALKDLNR